MRYSFYIEFDSGDPAYLKLPAPEAEVAAAYAGRKALTAEAPDAPCQDIPFSILQNLADAMMGGAGAEGAVEASEGIERLDGLKADARNGALAMLWAGHGLWEVQNLTDPSTLALVGECAYEASCGGLFR